MNIHQARNDRTKLMNITDMIAVAREHDDQKLILGEPERLLKICAAYYGGFNVASDTRNFDRLRGQRYA